MARAACPRSATLNPLNERETRIGGLTDFPQFTDQERASATIVPSSSSTRYESIVVKLA